MDIVFYVHDLFLEIGHSNVTIDMINNLPNKEKNSYKFVVFTHDDLEKLFPDLHNQVSVHRLPFENIRPIFIKIVFYQIYTFIYSILFDMRKVRVSLGISNLNSKFCVVHFLHGQWSPIYMKLLSKWGVRKLYKFFFYKYLNIVEWLYFNIIKPKTIVVSDFMKLYLKENFSYNEDRVETIHSGFNLERFSEPISKELAFEKLKQLEEVNFKLDFKRPICLFVGAYERKGFPTLLKKWKENKNDGQLVVIGKSEMGNKILCNEKNILYVEYTKNINLYYDLADYFLFPTIYEPFGMVLIEAAVKGVNIITTEQYVGAVEILKDLEGVLTAGDIESFILPEKFQILEIKEKQEVSRLRKKSLENYNWRRVSEKYYKAFND